MDVSKLDGAAIVAWAGGFGLPLRECVNVLWIAWREGAAIGLGTFLARYDDLWYPSADDIWICDASETWVLDLSHEEELTLWDSCNSR
jgi:hypothetical protein